MGNSLSGNFIGFTFNNVHSSTLGIMRISEGGRYNEDLLPTYEDKVVEAPGTDETYYFGSYYKQKIINIPIAFDDLNETQIRKIKQLFSDKQIHELWFDESPYKAYNVKINGTPNLKYICFEKINIDGYVERIYKGEGNISFIAYYPFAHSRYKYLEDYNDSHPNLEEWATTSRLRLKQDYDQLIITSEREKVREGYVNLWNAGDLETDIKINIDFDSSGIITSGKLSLSEKKGLSLLTMNKQGDDTGVQINSRLRIIQGYKRDSKGNINITSNIYNQYIYSGDFFKIPRGKSIMNVLNTKGVSFEVDYHYWYL